jgi:hypothetical protein
MTSRETPDISIRLHANMSLLCQRKSVNSLPYSGFKLALICMALASSTTLKLPDEEGMAGLVKTGGARRLSSISLATVTTVVANSMLFYS